MEKSTAGTKERSPDSVSLPNQNAILINIKWYFFTRYGLGRVDDLSFFDYLSLFCFLSIEFHCTFSISYKILPYFVYCYCILVRM